MRKLFPLIIALSVTVSGCVIDYGDKNEVTNASLWHYGNAKLYESVFSPAYELALFLFTDSYRTADQQQRIGMLKELELQGRFHQMDEENFHLDGYGDINTGGKAFAVNGWNTGWKKTGEDTWTRDMEVEVSEYLPGVLPYGSLEWDGDITVRCIKEQDGSIKGYTVDFRKVIDNNGGLKGIITLPEGPFMVSDPLRVPADFLYYYIYNGPVGEKTGLIFNGAMQIDIYDGTNRIDWVKLTADGKPCPTATTSRD